MFTKYYTTEKHRLAQIRLRMCRHRNQCGLIIFSLIQQKAKNKHNELANGMTYKIICSAIVYNRKKQGLKSIYLHQTVIACNLCSQLSLFPCLSSFILCFIFLNLLSPARNWCAYVNHRMVTTAVLYATETQTVKSVNPCSDGAPGCQIIM